MASLATIYFRCKRKRPYASYAEADDKARQVVERLGDDVRPFKCGYGNHWHIGHYEVKKN